MLCSGFGLAPDVGALLPGGYCRVMHVFRYSNSFLDSQGGKLRMYYHVTLSGFCLPGKASRCFIAEFYRYFLDKNIEQYKDCYPVIYAAGVVLHTVGLRG